MYAQITMTILLIKRGEFYDDIKGSNILKVIS